MQQAGAAVYFLLAALQLPLVAAALSAPALMGHLASTFHPSLLWGLPLTVSGITLWAFAEQRREAAAHGQASAAAREGEGEGDAPRLAPRVTSALLSTWRIAPNSGCSAVQTTLGGLKSPTDTLHNMDRNLPATGVKLRLEDQVPLLGHVGFGGMKPGP